MTKMLSNCDYDKIKLLHELSSILWFIDKHCHEDARAAGDTECKAFLEHLENDLLKHVEELKNITCK